MSATRSDGDALDRELKIEQLRFYRAANEERERDEHDYRLADTLSRRWGYPPPRRHRRWG